MAKYGIRVLDVMPLFVQTAMVQDMQAKSIQNMGVHLTAEDVAQHVFNVLLQKIRHSLQPIKPWAPKPSFYFN